MSRWEKYAGVKNLFFEKSMRLSGLTGNDDFYFDQAV